MFIPVVRAVEYLHSLDPPVAHRDIKVCVWLAILALLRCYESRLCMLSVGERVDR